jgi:hypothetical protein
MNANTQHQEVKAEPELAPRPPVLSTSKSLIPAVHGHGKSISTSTPPDFLRSLGAFEEIYWIYNQTGPRGFSYAMELEGPTTVEHWRKALDQVQKSQPFFSVCIEPNPGGRPYFRHVDCGSIPMHVLSSTESWEAEMAREVFTPFYAEHAPLLRAVLIYQAQRSIFILAAHHSILDGMSMRAVFHDIARALAGETTELHPMIPSQEQALGITRPNTADELDTEAAPPLPSGPPLVFQEPAAKPPVVRSLRFDATLTTQILQHARLKGTTVHGALAAALVQAGRRTSTDWRRRRADG